MELHHVTQQLWLCARLPGNVRLLSQELVLVHFSVKNRTRVLTPDCVHIFHKRCKDDNYVPYPHLCFTGYAEKKETVSGYGDCCSLASEHNARGYTLNKTSMECSIFMYVLALS